MISSIKSFLTNTIFYQFYKKSKAQIALMMYNNPSQDMFVVGITGTNGKTTTSFIVHHLFNTLIDKAFLLWTNEIKYGTESDINTSKMTSPDPMTIQRYLAEAKTRDCKIAVLEVASHGLAQQRFYGIDFDLGILTNITEEHLDYHKTMEDYANTKKKLFTSILNNKKPNKLAILPKDDKFGRDWIDELWFERMMTYSVIGTGTLKADNISYHNDHTTFTLLANNTSYEVTIPLVWVHNVYNTLAALWAGLIIGLDLQDMIRTLTTLVVPHGRMEHIIHDGADYFVDFAHTPDALDKTLWFLKTIKSPTGRIIVLTGAMGERDRFKRPMMGQIADQYADIIVLADEDPGDEPRFQIIQEVKDGIKRHDGDGLYIIPDRQQAIKFITEITVPGDLVLLAGKGHETVMCIPWGRIPRDEKGILEKYLSEKR